MASAVRFDRTTPLQVPFRIGYLPAGLRPSSSDTTVVRPKAGNVYVDLDLEGPGGRSLSVSTPGLLVRPDSGEGYTTEELKKVATTIQPVSDLDNPETWFDADGAIPR